MHDDPDYQEARTERNFARRRLNYQITHFDYRDPEWIPDESEDDDDDFR